MLSLLVVSCSAVATPVQTLAPTALPSSATTSPYAPPLAPHLTVPKYEKMQERRVEVQINWAGDAFCRLRAAEAKRFVKDLCPDVRVNIQEETGSEQKMFQLRIESKLITASSKASHSYYLPRARIMDAVAEARRLKRPPGTIYNEHAASD